MELGIENEMQINNGLNALKNQSSNVVTFLKGMRLGSDIEDKSYIDIIIRQLENSQVIIDDIKELLK